MLQQTNITVWSFETFVFCTQQVTSSLTECTWRSEPLESKQFQASEVKSFCLCVIVIHPFCAKRGWVQEFLWHNTPTSPSPDLWSAYPPTAMTRCDCLWALGVGQAGGVTFIAQKELRSFIHCNVRRLIEVLFTVHRQRLARSPSNYQIPRDVKCFPYFLFQPSPEWAAGSSSGVFRSYSSNPFSSQCLALVQRDVMAATADCRR